MTTTRRPYGWFFGLATLIGACQAPATQSGGSTANLWSTAGAGGTAGAGAAVGAAGTGTSPSMGTGTGSAGTGGRLTFDVLTHSLGGEYEPAHVGAIWIETSSGAFVKTLETWYRIRGRHLTKFMSETGGSQVDAVTGATLRGHTTHHATWNLTNSSGQVVPDGAYQVIVEVADSNWGRSQSTSVPFMKGVAGTVNPPDQQYFSAIKLTTP